MFANQCIGLEKNAAPTSAAFKVIALLSRRQVGIKVVNNRNLSKIVTFPFTPNPFDTHSHV
jgi:hypothetical protein